MEVIVFTVEAKDVARTGMPEGQYVVHYWADSQSADLMFKPPGARSFGPSMPQTRIEVQK